MEKNQDRERAEWEAFQAKVKALPLGQQLEFLHKAQLAMLEYAATLEDANERLRLQIELLSCQGPLFEYARQIGQAAD